MFEYEEFYLGLNNAFWYVKDEEIINKHGGVFQDTSKVVYDILRLEAKKVGKDLDKMIKEDPGYAEVAKSVVADILVRYIATPEKEVPLTQFSQAAGGYSVSGSYLVPGGGLFIKKAELARLGLRRQRYGVMDFYGLSD